MSASFRVCIIQDVPDSASQQQRLLISEAKANGLALDSTIIELRTPTDKILEALSVQPAIDWIVVDLLISPIDDHSPMTAAGLNLLRRLCKSGHFHGYKSRADAGRQKGVRCIAVYSASLAGYGGVDLQIHEELTNLGISKQHRYVPGEMKKLAQDICGELQRPGR
ncbi:MAG: hypothetical protein KDB53_04640 [Planctomycetes bacterium]|nr:hypothetical protein [Planctomycetota bacterium]